MADHNKPINPQRGTDRYNAKLTDEDVILIHQLVALRNWHLEQAKNLTNEKIGEKLGVHFNVIWKVSNYAGWIHVRDDQPPPKFKLVIEQP